MAYDDKRADNHVCIQKERLKGLEDTNKFLDVRLDQMETRLLDKVNDNKVTVVAHQNAVQKSMEDLVRTIKGANSSPGLVTHVHLNKQAIKRAWWWLGAISACILAWVFYLMRNLV